MKPPEKKELVKGGCFNGLPATDYDGGYNQAIYDYETYHKGTLKIALELGRMQKAKELNEHWHKVIDEADIEEHLKGFTVTPEVTAKAIRRLLKREK